jgi:hypothetical protein
VTFGTGWLEHGALPWTTERAHASEAHISASGDMALPDAAALDVEPFVTNQGRRESCFLETCVRWIHALTPNHVKCSTWVPWWYARLVDNTAARHDIRLLKNAGVSAYAALEAMRLEGACRLELCPADYPVMSTDEDPNAPVPPELMRDEAQCYNLDAIQLFAIGDATVLGLRGAIAQGLPACTTIRANEAYQRAVDGFGGADDGTGGWHSIYVDSYRRGADDWEFGTLSSWGTGHGISGRVWLPASRIRIAPCNAFARSVA